MKVLIYKNEKIGLTETFIKANVDKTDFDSVLVSGVFPTIEVSQKLDFFLILKHRLLFYFLKYFGKRRFSLYRKKVFTEIINKIQPDVILAQYGTSGIEIYEAAILAGVPYVVYFRGYDATKTTVIAPLKEKYKLMFQKSRANLCVSRSIRNVIISMGADPNTAFVNPSGADMFFLGKEPAFTNAKRIISVGRFVDKKGPHLLLLAFKEVLTSIPDAKLIMVGDGPLKDSVIDMTQALDISAKVEFKGALSHNQILEEMLRSNIFVQHSIIAQDGDSEGTPVAVMEASALGLPVIATKHAGITEVVIHGVTGYLVDEKDIHSMANRVVQLINDLGLQKRLGMEGKNRVEKYFSHKICLARLEKILMWSSGLSTEKPTLVPEWE